MTDDEQKAFDARQDELRARLNNSKEFLAEFERGAAKERECQKELLKKIVPRAVRCPDCKDNPGKKDMGTYETLCPTCQGKVHIDEVL